MQLKAVVAKSKRLESHPHYETSKRKIGTRLYKYILSSFLSWSAAVSASRGAARSVKLNLFCRAKSTSTGSPEFLVAMVGSGWCDGNGLIGEIVWISMGVGESSTRSTKGARM